MLTFITTKTDGYKVIKDTSTVLGYLEPMYGYKYSVTVVKESGEQVSVGVMTLAEAKNLFIKIVLKG